MPTYVKWMFALGSLLLSSCAAYSRTLKGHETEILVFLLAFICLLWHCTLCFLELDRWIKWYNWFHIEAQTSLGCIQQQTWPPEEKENAEERGRHLPNIWDQSHTSVSVQFICPIFCCSSSYVFMSYSYWRTHIEPDSSKLLLLFMSLVEEYNVLIVRNLS